MSTMTREQLIEDLKASTQNPSGMFEIGEETICALMSLLTAPPAPVVPAELHPDTQKLVTDFCTALAEKLYKAQLKYGYDADWKQDGWPTQCQAHFHQHIAKGDPRDVAAYCAFMWYHGWKTEAVQPEPVSVPTFDEWLEIRGNKPLGWVKDAMRESYDACRAAMLQGAENAEPPTTIKTAQVLNSSPKIAESPSGNSPVIPDGWVACNERLPENKPGSYEYLVFEELNNGVHHDYWNVPDAGDDCQFTPFWNHYDRYVTHWMPLPAAPHQEESGNDN